MPRRGPTHGHIRNKDPFALTAREERILELLAGGASRDEVAADLGIKPSSLSLKYRAINDKLLVDRIDQAVAKWRARVKQ